MIVGRNGHYYVVIKYKTIDGKTKKKWISAGKNRREAQRTERQLFTARDNGEPIFSRTEAPTVEQYLKEWLETSIKPPSRSLGTYENYLFCVDKILPLIGHVRLDKLSAIQITKAYKVLSTNGLSATSIRMIHRALRAALNKAVTWDILSKNPCLAADLPAPPASPSKVLDKGQAMALLRQSEAMGVYENAIIALGLLCGLRDAESCGLRWSDYQKEDGKLYIRHNLSERYAKDVNPKLYEYFHRTPSGKKALVLDKPKTESSNNFIMLPVYVQNCLNKLHLEYNIKKMALGRAFHDDNFILCNNAGIPYSPHKIYYVVQKAIRQYNETHPKLPPLPKIRAHDLRHTAATLLLEENIDIKYVSRQLRHSNTAITQNLYQHVTEKMANKTAAAMDNIFSDRTGTK